MGTPCTLLEGSPGSAALLRSEYRGRDNATLATTVVRRCAALRRPEERGRSSPGPAGPRPRCDRPSAAWRRTTPLSKSGGYLRPCLRRRSTAGRPSLTSYDPATGAHDGSLLL